MKIMIVESDWRFKVKVTRYFESRADWVVRQTPTGAVRCARAWNPDLVLLSAEYVNESLLAGLRALETPPAILLTEHMSQFQRAWRAWQLGGDELLMKPVFHTRELREAANTALKRAAIKFAEPSQPMAVPA